MSEHISTTLEPKPLPVIPKPIEQKPSIPKTNENSQSPDGTDFVHVSLLKLRDNLDSIMGNHMTIKGIRNQLNQIFGLGTALSSDMRISVDKLEVQLKIQEEKERGDIEKFTDLAVSVYELVREKRETTNDIIHRQKLMADLIGNSHQFPKRANSNDKIVDEKKDLTSVQQHILTQLLDMQFDYETCIEAVKHKSSVDECLNWINSKVNPMDMKLTAVQEQIASQLIGLNYDPILCDEVVRKNMVANDLDASMAKCIEWLDNKKKDTTEKKEEKDDKKGDLTPAEQQIVNELLGLGFTKVQCEAAAKSNTTTESAVTWIFNSTQATQTDNTENSWVNYCS